MAGLVTRLTRTGALLTAAALALAIAATAWTWDATLYVRSDDAWVRAGMITLSAETVGRVTERSASPGDSINAGDVLVRLDDREARLALAASSLELEAMQARRDSQKLKAGIVRETGANRIDTRRSELAESAADLSARRAVLEAVRADHARTVRLHDAGLVSLAGLERARSGLDQARLAAARAEATLAARRANVGDAVARLSEAGLEDDEARVIGLSAGVLSKQIAQLRIDLERHVIASPITGVIDEVFVEPGERVEPGVRIALLHNPDDVWIEANIKETAIARLRPGAHADITFDALPGQSFSGRVTRIRDVAASEFALLPVVNPTGVFTRITQRVPVRITLDGVHPALRPGAMATVKIRAAKSAR